MRFTAPLLLSFALTTTVAGDDASQAAGLEAAAAQILDDALPQDRREELIARHAADAPELLRFLVRDLSPGTPEEVRRIPWIWRVAVAAGRRNDDAELAAILDASVPKTGEPLLEWQAVVIGGGVINGIGLAGAWPSERIDAVLREQPALRDRWDAALGHSVAMSDDEDIIPGTRYDALRMVALRGWKEAKPVLERYLGHENAELQQGAVSGLSDVRNDEAPRMLLASLDRLAESNRDLALDALLRDADRMRLTLDAIERDTLKVETLGEDRLGKLRESDDPAIRTRASRLP